MKRYFRMGKATGAMEIGPWEPNQSTVHCTHFVIVCRENSTLILIDKLDVSNEITFHISYTPYCIDCMCKLTTPLDHYIVQLTAPRLN